jgi:cytochrome b subunit of formate dehydrogenase
MTTINGLLFSALGFSIGKSVSMSFFIIIELIGFVVSFSTLQALNLAMKAIDNYIKKFVNSDNLERQKNIAEALIIGHLEPKRFQYLLPQKSLPIIFGIAWLVITGYACFGLDKTIDKTFPSSVTPSPTSSIQSTPTPSGSPPQVKATNQKPAAQKTPLKTP